MSRAREAHAVRGRRARAASGGWWRHRVASRAVTPAPCVRLARWALGALWGLSSRVRAQLSAPAGTLPRPWAMLIVPGALVLIHFCPVFFSTRFKNQLYG